MAERATPTGPAAPELTVVEARVYRGGNIWSYNPAIHLIVDLGVLEGYPTDTLEGFTDRLLELLPGLESHTCSRGVKGGFVQRLREGTWLGHVAEHVSLQLQQEAGHDLRRGKTRAVKGVPGRYNVIYDYNDETVGLAAGRLAVRLVNHLVQAEPGLRLLRGAGRLPAGGPARVLRAVDGSHPRGGGVARHPVHPAQLRLVRAARAGRARPADPRDDDLQDRRPGGRHRQRQGHDDAAARLGRPAGPQAGDGPHRRRGGGRGPSHRLPRRRQAPRRQPRPRRLPRPHLGRRGAGGVRRRPGGVPSWVGHRRVVRHGSRLPLPDRRAARCRRSPSECPPTWSATASTPWPSWSTSPTPTRAAVSATRRS